MNQARALHSAPSPPVLSRGDLLALAAVALAYAIVFVTTRNPEPGELLVQVTRNIIPLALTAVLARHALRRWVIPLVGWRHRVAQVLLAVVFTFGWLWLLTVTAGLLDGDGPTRFQVYPFLFGPAVEWQLLQGFAFYLALAALTMLEARPPATGLVIIDDCAGVVRDRFLVRQDEEIAPILASDIVSVVGADDYTQVQTTNTQILVSTTLSEWEAALDPTRFLRAHRSAIVNLDRMLRAEPAGGGRTTLRMETGPDITASRTGTKLLRERLS